MSYPTINRNTKLVLVVILYSEYRSTVLIRHKVRFAIKDVVHSIILCTTRYTVPFPVMAPKMSFGNLSSTFATLHIGEVNGYL